MNAWNSGQLDVQYPDSTHKNADTERKYSKHEVWCFLSFLIAVFILLDSVSRSVIGLNVSPSVRGSHLSFLVKI